MPPDPATTLYVDLEVLSPVKLNAKPSPSYGTYARAGKVTHFVYAYGDEPATFTRDTNALEIYFSKASALVCHNMAFDLTCMRECPNSAGLRQIIERDVMPDDGIIDPYCTMAMASLLNLPRGLGALVETIGVGKKMDYDFNTAQTKGGDLFAGDDLDTYATNDVEIMRAAFLKMLPYIKPKTEWAVMRQHERVNARGVQVNRSLLAEKLAESRDTRANLISRFENRFHFKPSNTHELLKFIQRNGHPEIGTVDKVTLGKLAERTRRENVKDIIRMRGEFNEGDVDKLEAMNRNMNGDGESRLRNEYNYAGAHTARFTCSGVQIHNLKRGGLARRMLCAPPGRKLFVSDFHAIELRTSLWLAGHDEAVRVLDDGGDIYVEVAKEIWKGKEITKDLRYLAKMATLAMQYGASAGRIAKSLDIDDRLGQQIYDGFHRRFPGFARLAGEFRSKFNQAMHNRDQVFPVAGGKVLLARRGKSMVMRLPDGRDIRYPNVSTDLDEAFFTHGQAKGRQHYVRSAWTLIENFSQGYSRSFLAEAMTRFAEHPVAVVVGHTHDELIAEVPEDFDDLAGLEALMIPKELPEGLLVGAESTFCYNWADK